MKLNLTKAVVRIVCGILVFALAADSSLLTVHATTISALENQIQKDQQQLEQINSAIDQLSDEQSLVEELIDDLNAEIINMMTSIQLKEDEIAAKEVEIANKQLDIEQAQKDYEAAKKREEAQYEAMKTSVRFMYENSNISVIAMILESTGFSDLVNKAEYIEKVYSYADHLLKEYEAAKNQVQLLWDQLVLDKMQLESDHTQLENDRQYLQGLKAELDTKLAKKKQESADFEAEIQRYKKEANAAKKKIQKEQKELKKLQEQQKAQNSASSSAANGNYSDTGYSSTISNASGSDLGKKVAMYGCQYIGNPYVFGGTSLTNGADCSGFIYRIYKDFGYNLPRTSYEQRSAGTGVSYDQAQPGDIICYDGHVGIYIGGGKIVHASNRKDGIKVSNAAYRTILAVRRIV